MNLEKFVNKLNAFYEANPQANLLPVYVVANHGQSVEEICYDPQLVYIEEGDYTPLEDFEECDLNKEDINGVLIN